MRLQSIMSHGGKWASLEAAATDGAVLQALSLELLVHLVVALRIPSSSHHHAGCSAVCVICLRRCFHQYPCISELAFQLSCRSSVLEWHLDGGQGFSQTKCHMVDGVRPAIAASKAVGMTGSGLRSCAGLSSSCSSHLS